ncbi:MAG: outer membrane protein transport protein, partial [Elusimicrobia bacterium]|nr:outer membrane protein transport protein [Candidatus Obscuribacterium magneticum]
KLRWELNTAWYNWSANRQLAMVLPNATPTQRALVGGPTPLDWRDAWSFSTGVKYDLKESLALMGSLYYEPHVYPEQTFSPAVPDTDRYGLTIGSAYNKGDFGLDVTYNPIYFKKTTINNTLGQQLTGVPTINISGDYKAFIHIVSVNANYKF